MRLFGRNFIKSKLFQEILVFSILFILLTLNSWTAIRTIDDLVKALTYFLILYLHVQLQRFVLLPALAEKKRKVLYGISTLFFILLFSWLLNITDDYWFIRKYGPLLGNPWLIYLYHVGTCTLSLIAMLVPFLLLAHFNQQKKMSAAQLALHRVELKMLRSQLNPHFLFNAFNNIYGLSLKEFSRVPGLIQHVSNLMGYHIENNAREWIYLDEELRFIESYIALEEERLGKRCEIRYEYENDEPGTKYLVAPLVLISFIENAFKHGTYSLSNSFVHIIIKIKKKKFSIEITNSLPLQDAGRPGSGTGMINARQILDLVYPAKYTLTAAKDEKKYTVFLTLPLITKTNAE